MRATPAPGPRHAPTPARLSPRSGGRACSPATSHAAPRWRASSPAGTASAGHPQASGRQAGSARSSCPTALVGPRIRPGQEQVPVPRGVGYLQPGLEEIQPTIDDPLLAFVAVEVVAHPGGNRVLPVLQLVAFLDDGEDLTRGQDDQLAGVAAP